MLNSKFGIEIEFTGITRFRAAEVAKEYFNSGSRINTGGDFYNTHSVTAPDGRVWKFMSDASIRCQKKSGRQIVHAGGDYSVELVSPILSYHEDIKTVQELVRRLRKAGGFTNPTCGIHIHLNGADHSPRSIRNFVNIIASKNDLLYKALQIPADRQRYCKKMDLYMVEKLNRIRPSHFTPIETAWYEKYGRYNRNARYHDSRYYFLNLHPFFRNGRPGTADSTVELRGFNGELHAGKVRAFIVLALALNNQSLTQKSASSRKSQEENEKFAMRVYLNRIGFIGEEFKSCREHLYRHLNGNAAWRYGRDKRKDRDNQTNQLNQAIPVNQEGGGFNEN